MRATHCQRDNVTLVLDGRTIREVARDVRTLRDHYCVPFDYLGAAEHKGADGEAHYSPPGMYGTDNGIARYRPLGKSALFQFPPPYHPLELIAAVRSGFGGRVTMGPGGELVMPPETFELRKEGALAYFDKIGAYLNYTPATARLLAHLFTPMYGMRGWEVLWEVNARVRLYRECGLELFSRRALAANEDVQYNVPVERHLQLFQGALDPSPAYSFVVRV